MPRRMIPLEMEPPENRKYRLPLTPLFSPPAARRLKGAIQSTELHFSVSWSRVVNAISRGSSLQSCRPLCSCAQGNPLARKAEFLAWENTFVHSPDSDARAEAGRQIEAMNADVIAEKRQNPDRI